MQGLQNTHIFLTYLSLFYSCPGGLPVVLRLFVLSARMASRKNALRNILRGETEWNDGGWRAHVRHGKCTTFNGPNRATKKEAKHDVRRMLAASGGIAGVPAVKAQLMSEARAAKRIAAAAAAGEEARRAAGVKRASLLAMLRVRNTTQSSAWSSRSTIGRLMGPQRRISQA